MNSRPLELKRYPLFIKLRSLHLCSSSDKSRGFPAVVMWSFFPLSHCVADGLRVSLENCAQETTRGRN